MHSDDDPDLGAWERDDHLKQTATSFRNEGLDAGLPDHTRFVAGAAKAVRRRLLKNNAADRPLPAVFFLGEAPMDYPATDRVRVLNNGMTAFTGNVWFVNKGLSAGVRRDHGELNTETLLAQIASYGSLADRPLILFDPNEPDRIRWFAKGVDHFDGSEEIVIADVAVSLDEVYAAIDKVHKEFLIVPDAQDKAIAPLWSNASKAEPMRLAERTVQSYLRIGLVTRFPTCDIRVEQLMSVGRSDIEIERQSSVDGRIDRYALLELKVLRSHTSGGKKITKSIAQTIVRWGVRQTARYGKVRKPTAMALCCFDMRVPPDVVCCFKEVEKDAKARSVALKAWPLYNSTRAFDATS